jgi:NAD(P)-dependent dehydrogenase (short-subunit alcohol dehydrogenase family)
MRAILQGQRAVVTGGTRGIGLAIVEALLAEGCRVTFCGRSEESVRRAAKTLNHPNVYGCQADVSREDSVSSLFAFADQSMGGVDILVANAGIGTFRPAGDLGVDEWRRTIDVNLTGAYLCSREAIHRMRNSGGGFIVHISSLAARNPFAGGSAYNASKFGLNGMSEAMMLDHRQEGIRVATVMPGSVDTEFSPASGKDTSWKIAAADVAATVVFLLKMPQRTLVSRVEMRPSRPPT